MTSEFLLIVLTALLLFFIGMTGLGYFLDKWQSEEDDKCYLTKEEYDKKREEKSKKHETR